MIVIAPGFHENVLFRFALVLRHFIGVIPSEASAPACYKTAVVPVVSYELLSKKLKPLGLYRHDERDWKHYRALTRTLSACRLLRSREAILQRF
jgi:hypothetical protein